MRCEIFQNVFANFPGRRRRPKTSFEEIFKVSTLEETQGRPTKEKHDGATATDMQKDGLLFKKYTLINFTFFAFFCL